MEEKILLNIEELEERIAPHGGLLGKGHAAVEGNPDCFGERTPELELPNGKTVDLPCAAADGIREARGPVD